MAAPDNAETLLTSSTQSQTDPVGQSSIQKSSQNKPTKEKKKDKQQQNVNYKNNKDIRINPAAKKKHNDRHGTEIPIPPNISKDGPFAKQIRKLNKAIRIEAKKQKSKEVMAKKKREKPMETIVLDSSDSENDIVVVPIPPPPTYSIDDSDEDKSSIPMEIEPINSFAKPQKQQQQQSQQNQQQQNSSRCTSPCSVLSSDDFIGQTDRSRLLQDSGMADDEDLIFLTADVDSLMEIPKSNNTEKTFALESNDEQLGQISFSDVVCTEFITPNVSSNNYRVEQTQFRALDVYESESDITDSVYSKGTKRPKETIIRAVRSTSSSDENDGVLDDVVVREKIKRLRKRRASGSNRESDANNEIATSSDSDAEEVVNATLVPFIARGPAVEHCKTKPRRESSGGSSLGHMSDNEFIATLNNLAQGAIKGNEINDKDIEKSDSDNEAPTARAIAEQVLAAKAIRQHYTSAGIVTERSASESEPVGQTLTAVPENILTELDKVFETIDKLDKGPSILVEVSDESSMDTDVEITAELTKSKKQPQPISQPQIVTTSFTYIYFTLALALTLNITINDINFYNSVVLQLKTFS